jgi:hypothetical protein
MKTSPALQERASLGGTKIAAGRQELVIRGHDAYQCERDHGPDKHGSNEPLAHARSDKQPQYGHNPNGRQNVNLVLRGIR